MRTCRRAHAPASSTNPMISILVNGESTSVPSPSTVASLLDARGLVGKRVAVELNGTIVPRSRHASTSLIDADRLEIVVAVGGG